MTQHFVSLYLETSDVRKNCSGHKMHVSSFLYDLQILSETFCILSLDKRAERHAHLHIKRPVLFAKQMGRGECVHRIFSTTPQYQIS
jgi:hypothetical protein